MKALIFRETGHPADVLRLEDIDPSPPGKDEVLLRVLLSPVNPSDLHMIRGRYGYQPALPASPGAEAVGIVLGIGSGVTEYQVGDRVICIGTWNVWRERVLCKASHVVRVPADVSDEVAAIAYQNPLTAWALTQSVHQLKEGDWLLQTAATSSVGKLVLQLSKMYGFKTMNVIRHRDQAEAIRALGGEEIICTADEDLRTRIQELTGGLGVKYAIDCVAGEVGGEIVRNLAPAGMMVQFGALSSHRLTDPAKFMMPVFSPKLIYAGATVQGWWIPRWLETQPIAAVRAIVADLLERISIGELSLPETRAIPAEDFQDALTVADGGAADGKKILIRFS